jgi:hypothetical protein
MLVEAGRHYARLAPPICNFRTLQLWSQVLAWPGMSALLGWVAGGHYLGGLGPDDLGKALLDVQVSV